MDSKNRSSMNCPERETIREAAASYLARQDRTSGQMRLYLKKKGFSAEEIRAELDSLKELGYIDDLRYAQQFTERCYAKGWGFRRVKQTLLEEGAEPEALESLYADRNAERQRALFQANRIVESAGAKADGTESAFPEGESEEEWQKKRKEAMKEKQRVFGKIGRKLISLGYNSDTVYWAAERALETWERSRREE